MEKSHKTISNIHVEVVRSFCSEAIGFFLQLYSLFGREIALLTVIFIRNPQATLLSHMLILKEIMLNLFGLNPIVDSHHNTYQALLIT